MIRLFRHFVPASFVFLVSIELLLFYSAIYMGAEIRFWGIDIDAELLPLWPKALLFTSVMFVSMTAMGLYKNLYREGLNGMVLRLVASMLVALAAMSLLFYLFPYLFLGRGAFGWSFAIAVTGVVVIRVVFFNSIGRAALKRNVLVLGAGTRAKQFNILRRKSDQFGFKILGYVHVAGERDAMLEECVIHLDVPLIDYAQAHGVQEIVVVLEDRRKSFPVDDLLDCKMSGIDVTEAQCFFERETGKVRLESLHPSWFIFSDGFRHAGFQLMAKRGFDILASSLILFLAWPIMLLAAIAIFVENGFKGPILYKQVRVGQNWRLFQVLKFRSMVVDAEKDGAPQWAQKNDSRVTRIGKFLRRSRIDELPQIFNVLKGDMSFIGPRPERPEFVELLAEKIPYYAERHRVKPGITGWAQVRYPYGASDDDAREKLQYDLYYVKNYSLFLDCLIMFQTVEVVIFGAGAR